MVIFNSYVKLPEGITLLGICWDPPSLTDTLRGHGSWGVADVQQGGCPFFVSCVPWCHGMWENPRKKPRNFGGPMKILYFYGKIVIFGKLHSAIDLANSDFHVEFFFSSSCVTRWHVDDGWHRGRTSTSCCVQKVPTISRPTSCARASQSSRAMSGTQDPKRSKVHRDEISCLTILESCTRLLLHILLQLEYSYYILLWIILDHHR